MWLVCFHVFFFFKQKTAYEMRISDWSSDVCSSDLPQASSPHAARPPSPRRAESDSRAARPQRRHTRSKEADSARNRRSEERRVGKECVVRVDLGGRRIIKKNSTETN